MKIIHIIFEEILSTNVYAQEHISQFSREDFTIVSAKTQTGGRGQKGKVWFSPLGNIYATFCFFSSSDSDPFFWTRLFSEILQSYLEKKGILSQIKWPNDLLVSGKKIAGILTETKPFGDQRGIMVGLGLNVNMTLEMTKNINQPATSLFLETHTLYSPENILQELGESFCEGIQKKE